MAQSTDGFGTTLRVPVVVNSTTFGSTLTISNPNGTALGVVVNFHAGTGSAQASKACGTVNVPAGRTVEQTVAALCALPAPGGSQFGQLELTANGTGVPFSAYSRVQTFSGNGFSVEGFKVGSITGSDGISYVSGLKRQAAAPGYATNCFIASIGEPVDVSWRLRNADDAALGSTQLASLGANGMVRISDVFATVGAPAGDYSNVRAVFTESTAGADPGFVAFCTVQNNTSFDADFRIAKDTNPQDDRLRKFASASTTGLGVPLQLDVHGVQHVFGLNLQHPDWVQCAINGSDTALATLEMRLKDPDGNVMAGGNEITSFGDIYLGQRSTRSTGLWTIEVEGRSTGGTYPAAYSLTCTSSNGTNPPIFLGVDVNEF